MKKSEIVFYQNEIQQGRIVKVYQFLIQYMSELRLDFIETYPKNYAFGHLNAGHLDFTYFTLTPEVLKPHDLKVAIFLDHAEMRFEGYLVGRNQKNTKEWQDKLANKKTVLDIETHSDEFIAKQRLAGNPNFEDTSTLTDEIKTQFSKFIDNVKSII